MSGLTVPRGAGFVGLGVAVPRYVRFDGTRHAGRPRLEPADRHNRKNRQAAGLAVRGWGGDGPVAARLRALACPW